MGWAKLICICSGPWLWSENVSPGKYKESLAVGEGASEVTAPLCWIRTCNSCSRLLYLVFRWCLKPYDTGLSCFVLNCAVCVSCQGGRLGFGKEQLGDAACGGREGMEKSLEKLCQNKRLFKLRPGACWKCFSKTNLANTESWIYQNSSFSDCVVSCILLRMVWCWTSILMCCVVWACLPREIFWTVTPE